MHCRAAVLLLGAHPFLGRPVEGSSRRGDLTTLHGNRTAADRPVSGAAGVSTGDRRKGTEQMKGPHRDDGPQHWPNPPEPTRLGDVPWLEPYPDLLLDQLPGVEPGPGAR